MIFIKRLIASKDINIKIHLIVVFTALAAFLSVFIITYSMMQRAIISEIEGRAVNVNEYVQKSLNADSLINLNSVGDEEEGLYTETHIFLDNVRQIANIKYLYTAKMDKDGQLIYVVDGLPFDDPDFRHVGDPIEEELINELTRCLNGEIISKKTIIDTEWGNVYVTYWPVRDASARVVGAVGMEFNADYIVASYRRAGTYSILLSAVFAIIFIIIAHFTLYKVSEPFYKKLAYTDCMTGLPNRMAFEEDLKALEAAPGEAGGIILAVFDLNNLKMVNDTYGHHAGDIYIKETAAHISQAFRLMGRTYRIGGDELAVIVTDNHSEMVEKTLDGLFVGKKITGGHGTIDCAYGIAVYDAASDSGMHDTLKRADSRMYERKRSEKERGAPNHTGEPKGYEVYTE